jgi:IS5 family transposase
MTALVDTDSCAILNLHCSAHWPHNTQTGRRVALRNSGKIGSLAGDKGHDDQSLRDALGSEGVRPLLRHRLFAQYDHAHNARLGSELYGQRWMAETAFSAIDRRFGSAVHPCTWYREFRDLLVTATVYNLDKLSNSGLYAIIGFDKTVRPECLAELSLRTTDRIINDAHLYVIDGYDAQTASLED